MHETVQSLKYAYNKIGCFPKEIQTYNGLEFTDKVRKKPGSKAARQYNNYLESFLKKNNINHHLIRPRTPQHNGKVERSHRIDQDKFYKNLKFSSLNDLRYQGELWNKRYNNLQKFVLGLKLQMELNLKS